MVFWCYILECADQSFYTGHSDTLERRFGEHQAGGHCDYTSTRLPVRLAWCQEFPTRLEALEAERRIKSWSRKKKLALIAGDWAALSYWAVPPGEREVRKGKAPITPAETRYTPPSTSFAPSEAEGPARAQRCASTSLGTNGKGQDFPPSTPAGA